MTTISFQQSANGYTGAYDTMVRESKAGTDYRASTSITVDTSDSSGKQIQGLVYFSSIFGDGPGQIPLNATITSATLTLNVSDSTKDSFSLHRMLFDWHAAPTWTWNSFAGGIQADGSEALAAADLTVPSLVTGGTHGFDVTSSLTAWMGGQQNYGWLIQAGGADGMGFNSSEGAIPPKLTVTYQLPLAGLEVAETGGSTSVTEGGPGDSISVTLDSAPTSDVTISLGGNPDVGLAPTALTFTHDNWNVAQSVAVSAVNDTLVEPVETTAITLTSSSADPSYNDLTKSVSVKVIDNDTATVSPTVVHQYDTTQWKVGDPSGYGCSDPSGLAYVPSLNVLLVADSEHEESPFFSPTNLFAMNLDGTQANAFSLTSYTKEPTGLAYDGQNGFVYVTDDDADKVFWFNPANPGTKVGEFSVKNLAITDGEDPAWDPVTGHLFMLDGVTERLFELTTAGQLVSVTPLPTGTTGLNQPEAMAYDPVNDDFYIAGSATKGKIFQVDRDGDLLSTITVLEQTAYRNPDTGLKPKIKGLEFAPSSDPNDGHHMNLYVADYGTDQYADGRVFEVDLGFDWPLA